MMMKQQRLCLLQALTARNISERCECRPGRSLRIQPNVLHACNYARHCLFRDDGLCLHNQPCCYTADYGYDI